MDIEKNITNSERRRIKEGRNEIASSSIEQSRPEIKLSDLKNEANDQKALEDIKQKLEQNFVQEKKSNTKNEEDIFVAQHTPNLGENYPEFRAKGMIQQINDTMSRAHTLYENIFYGSETSNKLAEYVLLNSGKTIEQLNQGLVFDKKKVKELQGVTSIQQITLENGNKSYIIKIGKKHWHSLLHGPGIALSRRGKAQVAIVVDGFSYRSEKLITDHEIYHLNNHTSRVPYIQKLIRELDTVWETNIKPDIIGSLGVLVETTINIPNVVRTIIDKYITKK